LEKIVAHKKLEIADRKLSRPLSVLEAEPLFFRKALSLSDHLLDKSKSGIIAEFKRKSPSKGVINSHGEVSDITFAYANLGASGLSILTDSEFFGGVNEDLIAARIHEIPILRKDFIIDEYQIVEAKSIGADVILLIAACLTHETVQQLATFAKRLGLEVLLEIHDAGELDYICDEIDLVGVNNRDLKFFTVDINRSIELAGRIPDNKIKISESGISSVATITELKKHGFQGFLMGENFMSKPEPAIAFASFVNQLKNGIT